MSNLLIYVKTDLVLPNQKKLTRIASDVGIKSIGFNSVKNKSGNNIFSNNTVRMYLSGTELSIKLFCDKSGIKFKKLMAVR